MANVKQRPLRTAVSIAGVALGVILVVLTIGLARGVMRDSAERQTNVEAELRFWPPGNVSLTANPLMLPERYAEAIENGVQPTEEFPDVEPKPAVAGVAATTPVGEWVQSSGGGIGFEVVDGIDYESFIKTTNLNIIDGRPLSDGTTPETKYEAIVDPFYAENNRDATGRPVSVGSTITVLGNEFKVVGIYQPSVLGRVKIPLRTMQDLLGGARNCTFVMIRAEQSDRVDEVKRTIEEYYPGNRVIYTSDLPALYAQGISQVETFLDVVIGLSLIISMLVVLLAMYTTVVERTREIGILKSLGASKLFIIGSIEKEAALISLLGVVAGFIIAVIGKVGIEATTKLKIDLQPEWLLLSAGLALVGGLIGALYPAMRAANLDVVEAINYE